jgi:hypothetical protein
MTSDALAAAYCEGNLRLGRSRDVGSRVGLNEVYVPGVIRYNGIEVQNSAAHLQSECSRAIVVHGIGPDVFAAARNHRTITYRIRSCNVSTPIWYNSSRRREPVLASARKIRTAQGVGIWT